MVREVSVQDFQEVVLGSELPVLVDFWAPWCSPCRTVAPLIEKLSEDYAGKVCFCKVNVDEAESIATVYRIQSIPTLMVFKKGKEVEQVVGAMPEATLKSMIDATL